MVVNIIIKVGGVETSDFLAVYGSICTYEIFEIFSG